MNTPKVAPTQKNHEPLTLASVNPLRTLCPERFSGWNVGENRWLDHFYEALKRGDVQRLKGLLLVGLGSDANASGSNVPTDWTEKQKVRFYLRLCHGIEDEIKYFKANDLESAPRPGAYHAWQLAQVAYNMLCDHYFAYNAKGGKHFQLQHGRRSWICNLLEEDFIETIVDFFVSDELRLQNMGYREILKHRTEAIRGFLEALCDIIFTFSAVKFLGKPQGLSEEGVVLDKRVHSLQRKCLTLTDRGDWWKYLLSEESRLCKETLVELKFLALSERYSYIGGKNGLEDFGSKATIRRAAANGNRAALVLIAYNMRLMEARRVHRKTARIPARRLI